MGGMSNNQIKKRAADKFNKERSKRLEGERLLQIDKKENPDKYRSSKEALHHARMFMAIAAGFSVNAR